MIVFVHGVPETAAVWDKVRAVVDRDSVALALPGFGCPRPAGFGATKDDYVSWLAARLEDMEEPVDLVGHDWGAGFTYRIATARPELVRSWAADVGNVMHPDYEWHQLAKIWQTPEAGEAYFQHQGGEAPGRRAKAFEAMGVPGDDAQAIADAGDATMASCILDLYRSALPNPYSHWNDAWGPTAAPGIVLHASDDPFGNEPMAAEVASMLGADFRILERLGHWWPLQGPEVAAAELERFWTTVG